MPNIKSAAKRVRTSAKSRLRNRAGKSDVSASRRKLLEAIEAGNKEMATKLYSSYSSELDKTAKKGIIKANNASRKKSRLAIRLAKMA
jgi:small subunit ribosomal protein S20